AASRLAAPPASPIATLASSGFLHRFRRAFHSAWANADARTSRRVETGIVRAAECPAAECGAARFGPTCCLENLQYLNISRGGWTESWQQRQELTRRGGVLFALKEPLPCSNRAPAGPRSSHLRATERRWKRQCAPGLTRCISDFRDS